MIFQTEEGDPLLRLPRVFGRIRGFVYKKITIFAKSILLKSIFTFLLVIFLLGSSQVNGADEKRIQEEDGLFTYSSEYLREDATRIVFEEEDIEWIDEEYVEFLAQEKAQEEEWKLELEELLQGYPMQAMIPAMMDRDPLVVAFLVGIAKKESNWGKRVPLDANGNDCYNYWGYRAEGSLGTQRLGYGCFVDVQEAIDVVGERIRELALDYDRETPREMIVWKCGSSCAGHAPGSVEKWISDVDLYYTKVLAMTSERKASL